MRIEITTTAGQRMTLNATSVPQAIKEVKPLMEPYDRIKSVTTKTPAN